MRGRDGRVVQRGRLGRFAAPAALFAAGFLLLAMTLGQSPDAGAAQLVANGDFETWTGSVVANWHSLGGSVSESTTMSRAGSSARLAGSDVSIWQTLAAVPGATYQFTVFVATDTGPATAKARIQFLTGDRDPAGGPSTVTAAAGGSFTSLTVDAVAPAGAAFVEVRIELSGPILYVDDAALEETLPPPTATATATPTDAPGSTATPTPSPSPTETPIPTVLSTASPSATETATRTATLTRTATPTRTPTRTPTTEKTQTPTRTPTPPTTVSQRSPDASSTATPTRTATPPHTPKAEKTQTPTRTPTPPKAATAAKTSTAASGKPSPTATHSPQPSSFGGLVWNGDFENEDAGRPEGWTKYGGTMALTSNAHGGARAASLESDTASTKWLYQIVALEGAHWYIADGFARVEGDGEAFIRLSWYASDDGSGIAIDQADSGVVSGATWTPTSTGPVQSPPTAQSARVRLMLRPASAANVTAAFDDVELVETGEPARSEPPVAATPVAAANPIAADGSNSDGTAPSSPPRPTLAIDKPGAGGAGALRLSEILSDPVEPGRDSAFEWVELVNTGALAANTAGWRIGDAKEQDVLPAAVVPPGGYVVIAGRSVTAPPGVLLVRVADGEIGGGLNNGGDVIRLFAPDGSEVDAVSFGDNNSVFDPAPAAPPTGSTLGVRSVGADPDTLNWAVTERPTPGEANVFADVRPKPPSGADPGQGGRGTGAGAGTIIVERDRGGSVTLWLIGLLFLCVLGLSAYVLREVPGKLKRRSP